MHFKSAAFVLLLSVMNFHCVAGARLPSITNFACYYGKDEVKELSRYSLVILESKNYSASEIHQLKASGAIVVGYLSLGEILEEPVVDSSPSKSQDDVALPPYYLDKDHDGKPDRNPGWSSLYVDVRSPRWQNRVLREFIPEIVDKKGIQGLFLDTLDTVDLYPQTRSGMAELIRQIRENYPGIPLIANRGFSMLESLVGEVDAILFEAFTTRWDPASGRSRIHSKNDLAWVDGVLRRIRELSMKNELQVLVLDYADMQDKQVQAAAVARAQKAGLTYSITTGSLNRLPVDGGPQKSRREK
jgi:hypothetical protein